MNIPPLIAASCAVLAISCDRTEAIPFFAESAWHEPVHCTGLAAPNNGAGVADLIPVTGSSFAALFGDDRQLITYDEQLRTTHTLAFDEHGPRGVRRAVSAAVSDTLLFVADEGGQSIKRFDRNGQERGSVQLHFIPRRLRLSDGQLLVTPLVAGAIPGHLLFAVAADRAQPFAARIAQYDDVFTNTMANFASVAAFPSRVVLMHELIVPFGYVFDTKPKQTLRGRFAVPLSDRVRDRINHLPKPPITDKNVNDFTIVAFAAAPNFETGSTYYVTRIGDGRGQPYRKLLVELDSVMKLRAVYPIDANPHHIVHLRGSSIIGVDAESNWFECKLP